MTVATVLLLASTLSLNSCIGSFSLTNSVLKWNKQVGPKFINELVFFAFWILPVYEVTSLADLLVLNSIEFWSGNNPVSASVKAVDTDHGRYMIACDGNGYTVTHEATGDSVRLDFDRTSQTWSFETPAGDKVPFMTFIDDSHVRMRTPDGSFMPVELTAQGVSDYYGAASAMASMAAN